MKDFSAYQQDPGAVIDQGDRIAALLRQAAQAQKAPSLNNVTDGILGAIANAASPKGGYDGFNEALQASRAQDKQTSQDQIAGEKQVYEYLDKARQTGNDDAAKIKDGLDLLVGKDPEKQQQIIAHVLQKYPGQKFDSTSYLRPALEAMNELGITNNATNQVDYTNKKQKLELDKGQADLDLNKARANYYNSKGNASTSSTGLPPEYGNLNPKLAQTRYGIDVRSANKQLEEANQGSQKAQEILTNVDRIMAANNDAPSGSFAGLKLMGAKLASPFSNDMQRMATAGQDIESAQNSITASIRTPGEGSISNFERELYAKTVPGLSATPKGREVIAEATRALAQNRIDHANFLSEYSVTHNGLLNGANEAWNQYLAKNPAIIDNGKGGMAVNPNRGSYRDYIGGQVNNTSSGSSSGVGPLGLEHLSDEQLDELERQLSGGQ
jgi:hypothetical protein